MMILCEYDDDDKVEYADDVNCDIDEYHEMAPYCLVFLHLVQTLLSPLSVTIPRRGVESEDYVRTKLHGVELHATVHVRHIDSITVL